MFETLSNIWPIILIVTLVAGAAALKGKKRKGGGSAAPSGGGDHIQVVGDRLNRLQKMTFWVNPGACYPYGVAPHNPNDEDFYSMDDGQLRRLVDLTKETGNNCIQYTDCGFMLRDDNGQVDEGWFARIEGFVQYAQSKGVDIAFQVGSFWGKGQGIMTVEGPNGAKLNWWGGVSPTIQYYLEYVGSKLGRYPNVWFTFNEMDHSGLAGAFRPHLIQYVEILTRAAGRPVAVGVSESQMWVDHPQLVKLAHDERFFQGPGACWGYDEQAGGQDRWDWEANRGRGGEYISANQAAKNRNASVICLSSWVEQRNIDPAYIDLMRQMGRL